VHKVGRIRVYMLLALAVLLHMTVLDRFRIFGARPDLVLICVTFFGFFLGPAAGAESGLFAGALEDLFSLDFLGINAFTFAVTGLAAGYMSVKLSKESKRTRALLVFFLTSFSMVFHFLAASALSRSVDASLAEYLLSSVAPSGLYTAIVSVPVFLKLSGMFGLKLQEDYI